MTTPNPWNALWALLVGFFMILVDATIVSGEIVYRHGEPTGALPGRLLRAER